MSESLTKEPEATATATATEVVGANAAAAAAAARHRRNLLAHMQTDVEKLAELELQRRVEQSKNFVVGATANALQVRLLAAAGGGALTDEDLADFARMEEQEAAHRAKVEAERQRREREGEMRRQRNELIFDGLRDGDFSAAFVEVLQNLPLEKALATLQLYYEEGRHIEHRIFVREAAELIRRQNRKVISKNGAAGGRRQRRGSAPNAEADATSSGGDDIDAHTEPSGADPLAFFTGADLAANLSVGAMTRGRGERRGSQDTYMSESLKRAMATERLKTALRVQKEKFIAEQAEIELQLKAGGTAAAAAATSEDGYASSSSSSMRRLRSGRAGASPSSPSSPLGGARPRTPPEGHGEKRRMLTHMMNDAKDREFYRAFADKAAATSASSVAPLGGGGGGTANRRAAPVTMAEIRAAKERAAQRLANEGASSFVFNSGGPERSGVFDALSGRPSSVAQGNTSSSSNGKDFYSASTTNVAGLSFSGPDDAVWVHYFKSPVLLNARAVRDGFQFFGKIGAVQFFDPNSDDQADGNEGHQHGGDVEGFRGDDKKKPLVVNRGYEGVVMYATIGAFGRSAREVEIHSHVVLISSTGRVEAAVPRVAAKKTAGSGAAGGSSARKVKRKLRPKKSVLNLAAAVAKASAAATSVDDDLESYYTTDDSAEDDPAASTKKKPASRDRGRCFGGTVSDVKGIDEFIARSRHRKSLLMFPPAARSESLSTYRGVSDAALATDTAGRCYQETAVLGKLRTRAMRDEIKLLETQLAEMSTEEIRELVNSVAKSSSSKTPRPPQTAGRCGARVANKNYADLHFVRPSTHAAKVALCRRDLAFNRMIQTAVVPPDTARDYGERLSPAGGHYMVTNTARSLPPPPTHRQARREAAVPLPPIIPTIVDVSSAFSPDRGGRGFGASNVAIEALRASGGWMPAAWQSVTATANAAKVGVEVAQRRANEWFSASRATRSLDDRSRTFSPGASAGPVLLQPEEVELLAKEEQAAALAQLEAAVLSSRRLVPCRPPQQPERECRRRKQQVRKEKV